MLICWHVISLRCCDVAKHLSKFSREKHYLDYSKNVALKTKGDFNFDDLKSSTQWSVEIGMKNLVPPNISCDKIKNQNVLSNKIPYALICFSFSELKQLDR